MAKKRSTKRRQQRERTKNRRQRLQQAGQAAQAAPVSTDNDTDLARAVQSMQTGQLDSAQQLLLQITRDAPNNGGAWHCLGIVQHQLGENQEAEQHLRRAILLEPGKPTFQSNFSLILIANNKLGEAAEAGRQAYDLGHRESHGHVQLGLQLLNARLLQQAQAAFDLAELFRPLDPVIPNCLGIVLRQLGQTAAAKEALERALALRPDFPEAHNNLGNVLRDQEELSAARASYEHAVAARPEFAEAQNNLGTIFLAMKQTAAAIEQFRTALNIRSDYIEALNNLGNALRLEGRLSEAAQTIRQAIDLQPELAELHNNLGNVLRDAGELNQAIHEYQLAIQLKPEFTEACNNLGTTFVDQGQLDQAETYYRVAANQGSDEARRNLGNVYRLQHRLDEAQRIWQDCQSNLTLDLHVASLFPVVFSSSQAMQDEASQRLAQWQQLAGQPPACDLETTTTQLIEPPFHLQFCPGNLRQHKEAYAQLFDEHFKQFRPRETAARDKPAVGIVVTRKHEGIFLKSLSGVLNRLPTDDCDLIVFAATAAVSRMQTHLQRANIQFVGLPERFDLQAKSIEATSCDVLYYWEVGTDAANYFLPFLRLAPVQLTSWGVQVTSGIPNVDYYLSSSLVEADDAQDHYSESLLLADGLLSYQEPIRLDGNRVNRDDFQLPESANLYVCAQQTGKFHPEFDSWLLSLLEQDRQALIVTTGDRYGFATEQLRQRWQSTLGKHASRMRVLPHLPRDKYLGLISLATVCLDPPHFGGVNSTYDAFSSGKAVVSLPSRYQRGRYTYGCYRRMQLESLVATSPSDYIAKAVHWGTDKGTRRKIEREIVLARELLFCDQSAVENHRTIFQQLIEQARNQ